MEVEKKYLIYSNIAIALLVGLLTSYFTYILNQDPAKPTVFIQSIRFFASPDDSVDVPESLKSAGQGSVFVKLYQSRVSAAELDNDRLTYEARLARLEELSNRFEQWKNKPGGFFANNKGKTFSGEEIADLPFLSDQEGREFLARKISTLPSTPLPDKCLSNIIDASITKSKLDSIDVAIDNKVFYFIQSDKVPSEREDTKWEQVSSIIGCGWRAQLKTVLNNIKEAIDFESGRIKTAINAINTVIKQNARMEIEVVVYNSGGKPILISPLAYLHFPNTTTAVPTIKMKIIPSKSNGYNDSIDMYNKHMDDVIHILEATSGIRKQDMSGFKPKDNPLFPTGGLYRYESVPGNSSKKILLESEAPLPDADFDKLRGLFTGAICAQITLSVAGATNSYESTPVAFGNDNVCSVR